MSKFAREEAVLALTPTADHSAKRGYLVKNSSGSAALNDSATVPAMAVILDGEPTTGKDSVALLRGGVPPVKLKASGTIAKFDLVQQAADGTVVTDAGTGARVLVAVAMEAAAAGELFEAAVFAPLKILALSALTSSAIATADGSDAGTTQTLANALKVGFNLLQADVAALRTELLAVAVNA